VLPDVPDTTSTLVACDLDNDGVPELPLGNGDVNYLFAQTNRVLRHQGGVFVDADMDLGFNFSKVSGVAANLPDGGVTEELACADLDGDGATNVVAFGNGGSPGTWLFFRPWPVLCGDEFCEAGEAPCSCPGDCAAVCGDGCCTGGETDCTCPSDCPTACGDGCCTGGETACGCPGDCAAVCGDGCCAGAETQCNCPTDCGPVCGDGCCSGACLCPGCPENGCPSSPGYCPADCGTCGC
jgi:hypothetical protein